MQIQCLRCKGRGYCGREFCPIYAKAQARFKVERLIDKESFSGASPAPFVGRVGYPYVNVGILSPPERVENAWEYDAPRFWAEHNYAIPTIIDFRSSLINSRFTSHVRNQNGFLEISQEVGMASRPVEVEIELDKKPVFRMNYDAHTAPMGPNARLKRVEITSNPKIPSAVDRVVDDADLKATEAALYLNKKGFDENYLSRLLSVGTIGLQMQRRLVPTRFSITAVDDMIGKALINEIKDCNISDYLAYFGGYLGNYFLIMFFPEVWSYELFETYAPKAEWNISDTYQFTTDYELYDGRKNYAENTSGGYYAARIGILEKLRKVKRQASVLCLRFITGEYAVPLGVWVVRESIRKALNNKPTEFSSRDLMLRYAQALMNKKFGFDILCILQKSILLNKVKTQSKLSSFCN
jgi:hypothetical protein